MCNNIIFLKYVDLSYIEINYKFEISNRSFLSSSQKKSE